MEVQETLTGLQADYLLISPLFFSPVKIVVSTVQIIGNLALAAILAVGALIALIGSPEKSIELFTSTYYALAHSIFGWGSLALAILNLASLGIVGKLYNQAIKKSK